ncbi:porin [Cupriavidus sp. PET2-C1]
MRKNGCRSAITGSAFPRVHLRQLFLASLAATALGCAASASAAQPDGVSLSGLVTAGPTVTSNVGGASRYGVDSGPYRPNYIAMNGSETLSPDMAAYFRLAGRFFADNGQTVGQLFNTNAIVGLRGSLGDLALGYTRDFMFDFLTIPGFSGSWFGGIWGSPQGPFLNFGGIYSPARAGSFDADRTNGEALANAAKYTRQFGPLKLGAMYALGERTSSINDGSTYSLGALYETPRYGAAVAYTDFRDSSTPTSRAHFQTMGLGAKWNIGESTIAGSYTRVRNALTNGAIDTFGAGSTVPVGDSYTINLHYQYMKGNAALQGRYAHQVLLKLDKALSLRTHVYLQAAFQKAGGTADAKAFINGAAGPSDSNKQVLSGLFVEHAF